MESFIFQMCVDGLWKKLIDGNLEYRNEKNRVFFKKKIVRLMYFLQEYMKFYK